jgi:hypothetical protein
MDIKEIGWGDVDWIDLTQDMDQRRRALVNAVMNLRIPLNAGKFLSGCTVGGFSRRAQLHDKSTKNTQACVWPVKSSFLMILNVVWRQ